MAIYPQIKKQKRRTWDKITETMPTNPFNAFLVILADIGVSEQNALDYFTLHYGQQVSCLTDAAILTAFNLVYLSNLKKYIELYKIYENEDLDLLSPVDITEHYTDTRTPDLISTSTSAASGTSDTKINQSSTVTNTPGATTTVTNQVNPSDDVGLRTETQSTTSPTGYDTVETSYSGDPDHAATLSSATSSTTNIGTETIEHILTRKGRDGKLSIDELINNAVGVANNLNLLNVICEDIANEIFLQVW